MLTNKEMLFILFPSNTFFNLANMKPQLTKLMKAVIRLHPLLEDQGLRQAYFDCEKALESKPKGKCLMRNSGLSPEDIEFTGELSKADKSYYFNAALDWSDANSAMKVDWIATIRGFARRDLQDGKLKISKTAPTGTNQAPKFEPKPKSETAMTYAEYCRKKGKNPNRYLR